MSKRELIDTGTDKRHKSTTEAKRGEGDRGDHHAKH
jgi:hypothetical protein